MKPRRLSMGNKSRFLSLAFLVVTSRAFDIYTTAIYTPDLTREANLLVHFLGAGWTALLVVQVLVVLTLLLGLHYYIFRYRSIRPAEQGLTMKQYISYFCFSDKNSFRKVFYETPTNKTGLLAISAYVTTMTLVSCSFLVGISTTFLIISPAYKYLYKHGVSLLLMASVFVFIFYFTFQFFRLEYQKYRLVSPAS